MTRAKAIMEKSNNSTSAQCWQALVDVVGHELREPTRTLPFFVIDGSSGIGKTQMAIQLCMEFDGVFLVCTDNSLPEQQIIYSGFRNVSSVLLEAAHRDRHHFIEHQGSSQLENQDLFVAGFVGSLLRLRGTKSDGRPFFMRLREITNADSIGRRKPIEVFSSESTNRHMLIVLDEVVAEDYVLLAGIRDTLRACGAVVVMCGTDATIANMIEKKRMRSSRSSGGVRWARLVLPPSCSVDIDCGSLTEAQQQLCRQAGRGYFGETILNFLNNESNSIANLDDIINAVAGELYRAKPKLRNDGGLRGQACSLLPMYQYSERQTSSVTSHLALLWTRATGETKFIWDLWLRDGRLYFDNDNEAWQPRNYFPDAKTEPFLYLCLHGTKDYPALMKLETRLSVKALMFELAKSSLVCGIDLKNPNAPTKNADLLEAAASTAMVLSSHQNGTTGVSIDQFVRGLISEWSTVYREPSSVPITVSHEHGFLRDVMVPYLLPQGSKGFGDWMKASWKLKWGEVYRPPNSDMVDLLIDDDEGRRVFVSGEAKYRKSLTSDDLFKCLERVPRNSLLHVLFCETAQDRYFFQTSKKAQEDRQDKVKGLNYAVMRVSRDGESLCLKNVLPEPLRDRSSNKLVLLLPLDACDNGSFMQRFANKTRSILGRSPAKKGIGKLA